MINLYLTLYGVHVVPESEAINIENAVVGVKSWFSSRQGPWLIVFDGADTIENERSSEYIDIKYFIPNIPSLHVIITSRSSTTKDMTRLSFSTDTLICSENNSTSKMRPRPRPLSESSDTSRWPSLWLPHTLERLCGYRPISRHISRDTDNGGPSC